MKIVIDPIKYGAHLHSKIVERKRQEIEARAELLLEHAFRSNDMNSGASGMRMQAAETSQKIFQLVTETLTKCKEDALQLSIRSGKLVSAITGVSEPQKEMKEKAKVDSVVLIHVLKDIENELSQSLLEISNNLEELEKAW